MAHSIGNHGSFPHPRPLSHGGGRGEHPWRGSPLASHAGEGVRERWRLLIYEPLQL